ncbi:MAG: hypothetical protein ABR867_04110 [Nitrososphaerales archaeon]
MVLAVAFVADISNPVLPFTGGAVGQVDEPPVFTEAVFGFFNVNGRLFNVSVSSVSMGPYALNQVPKGRGSAAYLVLCYQADSCLIGFYTINDSAIHDYIGSVSSVPFDVSLSNGEVVRGNLAVEENPSAGPGPGSGLIATKTTVYASGRVLESNLSAWILLNESITSPIVQVTIGDQTVNSSYFTRRTYSVTLPNGTMQTVLGPIVFLHGPVVYYVMENAGRQLPVTLWLEDGGRVNSTLLAESLDATYLRQ